MGAAPAQALNGVVALALAAYGGWCCLRRDHHQHKMGEPEGAGGSGDGNGAAPQEIDEDLHSRQLAVYRRETMRRLFASDVLVSGLNGR